MSQYHRSVFWTLQFPAVHCWPEAGFPVEFLRNPHRHLFKIQCRATVQHNDRDIEFLTQKELMQKFCDEQWANRDIGRTSCEDIAQILLEAFDVDSVTVSEDGENGATLARLPKSLEE